MGLIRAACVIAYAIIPSMHSPCARSCIELNTRALVLFAAVAVAFDAQVRQQVTGPVGVRLHPPRHPLPRLLHAACKAGMRLLKTGSKRTTVLTLCLNAPHTAGSPCVADLPFTQPEALGPGGIGQPALSFWPSVYWSASPCLPIMVDGHAHPRACGWMLGSNMGMTLRLEAVSPMA